MTPCTNAVTICSAKLGTRHFSHLPIAVSHCHTTGWRNVRYAESAAWTSWTHTKGSTVWVHLTPIRFTTCGTQSTLAPVSFVQRGSKNKVSAVLSSQRDVSVTGGNGDGKIVGHEVTRSCSIFFLDIRKRRLWACDVFPSFLLKLTVW